MKKLLINGAFLLVEAILGVLIQTSSGTFNIVVSFSAIVIAFLFSLVTIKRSADHFLTTVGLFTTVIADIFLVVINPRIQVPAMIFFSITQICYFVRIYLNHERAVLKRCHIAVRIVVVAIALALTVIVLKEKTDLLSLISLFYYANLIVNIVFSFINGKRSLILSIGLLLFACCDLFIGFNIMASAYIELVPGTLLYSLANPGFNIAWAFYVPSQALIAISNIKLGRK